MWMWKSVEKLTVHFETIVRDKTRRIIFFFARAINEQLNCASFVQILPFLPGEWDREFLCAI